MRLARRLRTVVSAGLGCVLLGGLVAAAPGASAATGPPDDQPLPGYTISNPPLPPATVGGQAAKVLQGVHEHAAYDIEVPPKWNGSLALWAHGYRGQGTVLTVDTPSFGLRQQMLDQGYAWAASSYYDNGYDVRSGVTTTRDLATLFGKLVGKPKQVFLAGVSMGGQVIGRSLEQYPGYYAGALPMCGVLGDQTLFDFFDDYNLVAQDLAGVPAFPVPADYLTNAVPKIQAALGLTTLTPGGPDTLNAKGAQLRAITVNRSGGSRPGADNAFAFWKDFLFSIAVPSGGTTLAEDPGQVAQNVLTRYEPNTPVNVNATVRRVAPANLPARLSPALTQIPHIYGVPRVPVLTLHGIGDMFVPFSMEQAYRADVDSHGEGGLVVQRAIRSVNHCEFDATEAGSAWNDLVSWVDTGQRPAGDAVDNPKTVASPTFGCRFTDPAAHTTGTRPLFPACP
jgi:pimeloyl-ACP methyl ester carboxylesterase